MATENYIPDEKDLSILRILQKDAKLSVRDIAARINLSPTPTPKESNEWKNWESLKNILLLLTVKK